jgi:hypothetical protein
MQLHERSLEHSERVVLAVAEEVTRLIMTRGAGRVKADATHRDGPTYSPFFTLEHGKEMIECSRFNIAPVKKGLAVVEHPVVIAEVGRIIR